MKNVKPTKVSDLLTSCQDLAIGAGQVGDAIGIKQNTQTAIQAAIAALQNDRESYEAAKVVLDQRRQVVFITTKAARQALTIAREILKLTKGNQHSPAWDVTGFTRSLEIPTSPADVQDRLQIMHGFFVANPTMENAPLDVTATRFQTLFNDMSTARGAVHTQEMTVESLLAVRNATAQALGARWRSTVNELGFLLTPLDARWSAFGLNKPGAKHIPDVPGEVTAVLVGPGAASVKWVAAPRAEHYRVWRKVNGVDQDLIAVGSPTDANFTIEGLPANSTILIGISAVNNGGESQVSQLVTIVT